MSTGFHKLIPKVGMHTELLREVTQLVWEDGLSISKIDRAQMRMIITAGFAPAWQ